MKNNKGFTLVELISVIALLLVLSVLAVVAYSNITDAARRAAVSSDANTVARSLNSFNSIVDNGDRITAVTGLQRSNDQFNLNVKVDGSGTGKGPVDLDLTTVVGEGRGQAVVDVLVAPTATVNMWTVDMSLLP